MKNIFYIIYNKYVKLNEGISSDKIESENTFVFCEVKVNYYY